MKKILSLVLAAMMIFSVLPAAFAAETAVAAEVSEDVVEAITLLNDLGIYKGYENGDMGVDDLVQRYQMSIFATRFKSGRVDDKIWATTENDSGFTDVVDFAGASDYVLGMISYAAQAGIVNGTGDNKFEPNLYVKYKEAITMVVRALGQVYSAASYPWAYIQFANDNGLLAGIDTDIAPDDFVSRGVIAQLLYNALFAEINGVTVAEKNFGIGYTTVMVTASNNVVYEAGAAKVLSGGKIRFAEVDVQGEPVGADYHVDAKAFGLDAATADAAVGTLYNVYYKNSFADILSAESLAVVYENRGWDNMAVTAEKVKTYLAADDYAWYVTLDGAKYLVVDAYTDLNRKQGPASSVAGTAEMKVYSETGAGIALSVMKPGYKLSADGMYIYDLTYSAANNFFTPVAYYSEALDLWYTQANGRWEIVDPSVFFVTYKEAGLLGFAQQDNAANISAYADITVSANERMTVREYKLGYITYSTDYHVDIYGVKAAKKTDTFKITSYDGDTTATTTETLLNSKMLSTTEGYYWVEDYRWTGLQKAKVAKNSYILYYIDTDNKEIDVLEVVSGNAADGTGTVTGYIRGFDLSNNTLTFGANYDVYTFDYDTLAGATIKSLANNKAVTAETKATEDDLLYPNYNFWYLDGLYDKYVTLVIVDGKVVHIAETGAASHYVIIDKFVSFEEDGVVADAWSTVDKGYTQIKIASFEGWSVGGFDYWMYFLGNIPGSPVTSMKLPFDTYELYRVVSQSNGVYDLTSAGDEPSANKDAKLTVNPYGYIEGVDKDGKIAATNIVPTADTNYWMILETKAGAKPNEEIKTVYSLNGKIAPVGFEKEADYYLIKDTFVITLDADEWSMSNNFFGNDIKFYKYNKIVNYYDNQNYLNQLNPYTYKVLMTDISTGATDYVQLGTDSLLGTGYTANKMYNDLVEGAIYMAVDGVITDVTEKNIWTLAKIAEYYDEYVPAYARSNENITVNSSPLNGIVGHNLSGITSLAGAVDLVTLYMDEMFYPNMQAGTTIHDANVTIIAEKPTAGQELQVSYGNKSSDSTFKAINTNVFGGSNAYHMYFVVNSESKTAIVWFDYTGNAVVSKTIDETKTVTNLTNAPNAISLEYVPKTDTLTITVDYKGALNFDATTDKVRGYVVGYHTAGVDVPTAAYNLTDAGKLDSVTWSITGVTQTQFDAITGFDLNVERTSQSDTKELHVEFGA